MINKIKKKIKTLTIKAVEKYSLIQLDAKEKRNKKREEKRKKIQKDKELYESFCCPYCKTKYTESQYHYYQTKKEDIKIEKEHHTIFFNFVECRKCKELFGVKEENYYTIGLVIFRSSFKLKDKFKNIK